MHRSGRRSAIATLGVLLLCLGVAACTQAPPEVPIAESEAPVIVPSSIPEEPPSMVEGGSAAENRPYFDYVNSKHIVEGGALDGRSLVDTLAAAGFDKSAMEVTPDVTPVGHDVDSVVVSVRIDDGCLIAQVTGGAYSSSLADTLSTGACLIGVTRTIDW